MNFRLVSLGEWKKVFYYKSGINLKRLKRIYSVLEGRYILTVFQVILLLEREELWIGYCSMIDLPSFLSGVAFKNLFTVFNSVFRYPSNVIHLPQLTVRSPAKVGIDPEVSYDMIKPE